MNMHIEEKVKEWISELKTLSTLAGINPHEVHCVFTRASIGKWRYVLRTTPGVADHTEFQRFKAAMESDFLPAVTGRNFLTEHEKKLLSLPVRFGGLGFLNPASLATTELQASQQVTAPMAEMLKSSVVCSAEVDSALDNTYKSLTACRVNRTATNFRQSVELDAELPSQTRLLKDIASQKGASSWLSVVPLKEHGFLLSKSDFFDAMCLRYNWPLSNLPAKCVCNADFTVSHAMTCPHGAFPTARHNAVRDILAGYLQQVVADVQTEPALQPISGERLSLATASVDPNARLDIRARDFWQERQCTFFDVRITHPAATSTELTHVQQQLSRHERAKERQYGQRIREVERAGFTPLIFSTNGLCGPECAKFLKRLASLLYRKNSNVPYSVIVSILRARLSFALLSYAIMCLRGCRNSRHHMHSSHSIQLAAAAFRFP